MTYKELLSRADHLEWNPHYYLQGRAARYFQSRCCCAPGLQNEARGASVSDMYRDWFDGAGGCSTLPGEPHRGGKRLERSKIAGKLLSPKVFLCGARRAGRGAFVTDCNKCDMNVAYSRAKHEP